MRRKDREVTDPVIIEKILNQADVCHVAFSDGLMPYIVTMNFGYVYGSESKFYFHCATAGRKLEIIKINNNVCFHLDINHKLVSGSKSCDFGMKYESITGFGKIFEVIDNEEINFGLNLIMKQYTGKSDFSFDEGVLKRTKVLRIDVSKLSCKIKS